MRIALPAKVPMNNARRQVNAGCCSLRPTAPRLSERRVRLRNGAPPPRIALTPNPPHATMEPATSLGTTPEANAVAGPSSSHADSPLDIAVKRRRSDTDEDTDEPETRAKIPMTYKRNPKACTCVRDVF